MTDIAVAVPPAGFKDRRTGLMVFGILVIVLGCFVALMVPFMLLGQLMAGRVPGGEAMPLRFLMPVLVMYLGLAVAFIWLGIGSVQCRRWARAILQVRAIATATTRFRKAKSCRSPTGRCRSRPRPLPCARP